MPALLVQRLRKLALFARPGPAAAATIHPWPWSVAGRPYFVENPVTAEDRHGGYGRRYAFDDAGVPYEPVPGGRIYRPMVVARYGLKQRALAARGAAGAAERARAMIAPLVTSAAAGGVWGPGPAPDAMSGTIPSGMAQGVVVSALLRLAGDGPWTDVRGTVDRALAALLRPVEEGGALSELDGGPFLEEFPRLPPSHILNGCLYALFGLYDAADALGHAAAASVAAAVERTLSRSISRFETRWGWTHYALDVFGYVPLASVHYHRAHAALVGVVAARTGDARLAAAAARWERALGSTAVRASSGLVKAGQAFWMRSIRRLPLHEG